VAIKALMVDVDGVLVDGRPEDGRHWSTGLERDLGLKAEVLQREFFQVHWDDIVLGREALEERLRPVLAKVAPRLTPETLIAYWFEQDSRIVQPLLSELILIRADGLPVFLATNQEHLRAKYLMQDLGLAKFVDGIFYSAQLGVKKPDRAFFEGVCSSTGFDPSEVVMIDDSLQNVEAASEAGLRAVRWTHTMNPQFISNFLREDRSQVG
jgi:putative hydrolase of the HAD superfamily